MQSVKTSVADWWNESYFPELCSFVLPMEWVFTEVLLVICLSTGFQFVGRISNTMKTRVIASLLGILCRILGSRKWDSLLKAMWKLCLNLITLKMELFVALEDFPKKAVPCFSNTVQFRAKMKRIIVGSFTKLKWWWPLEFFFKLNSWMLLLNQHRSDISYCDREGLISISMSLQLFLLLWTMTKTFKKFKEKLVCQSVKVYWGIYKHLVMFINISMCWLQSIWLPD